MTHNHDYAHRNQYDCFCYHLLCAAVLGKAKYEAFGFDCFLFSETYEHKSKGELVRQTVYYLAHKRLNQPTRKERGCWTKEN